MTPVPAQHRPMHYCSICLQSPEHCTCLWAQPTVTPKPLAVALLPLPDPEPPDNDTQAALPIEWPDRKDIA